MKLIFAFLFVLFSGNLIFLFSQTRVYWHNKERELRYQPQGDDFVIVNGDIKFNRALYGTNTAFRLETGDVPEFGFFMPHMGGNLQLGLIRENRSLWLNNADYIKSVYRAGARIYEIRDPLIGDGKIEIWVLAMSEAEGMIMQIRCENLPPDVTLLCMFGGASNQRFSRNGDLGVDDPNGFALNPDACLNNNFNITGNTFCLQYGPDSKSQQSSIGVFPSCSELKTGSPYAIISPVDVWRSSAQSNKPVLLAKIPLTSSLSQYIAIKKDDGNGLEYSHLEKCFIDAELKRKTIAETVQIVTPDPFINPLGGVLSIAADGIWDECWQHGAIGWRMPLNGWRAGYTGDAIGWHQRARKHFDGYAASQIKHIEPVIAHPSQDTMLHLARAEKKWGTQMYSNGYICRNPNDTTKMHHYDMNLCYIDELLWHLNWTGDMEYARQMWPVLDRHLKWEKRNFDPDDDGLYDAYASIWASDALYYNSGGVTHSSAYNYRANRMAAEIATKIGVNPEPYAREARKIMEAINASLWLRDKGWWAEYKDYMGNRLVHSNAAVWTIYHAIDSDIHTPFQAYQAMRYVDTKIPRIPVLAKGLDDEGYYTISTTNWLPYSWSVNNVAFAEAAHTSLAYGQTGRYDEGFKLFKSSVLDGMYLGSSPGNIGQISFYDAARGECYRDFGDPIGVYSRVLIQGLFGILPDLMNKRLVLRPGFPEQWNHASVSTPGIDFAFKRDDNVDTYTVNCRFNKPASLELLVKGHKDGIKGVYVNGEKHSWELQESSVGFPQLKINCEQSVNYIITIEWKGRDLSKTFYQERGVTDEIWKLKSESDIIKIYDPQGVLKNTKLKKNFFQGILSGESGHRTLFLQLKQERMVWWEPIHIEIMKPLSVQYDSEKEKLQFSLVNNMNRVLKAEVQVNSVYLKTLELKPGESSELIDVPTGVAVFGTNKLCITESGQIVYEGNLTNWNIENVKPDYKIIDIDSHFNASVTDIFTQEYLSPRSPFTTLQIPKQGIGEWCHPLHTAVIDDAGLRKAVQENVFITPFGIPFRTSADSGKFNTAFSSLWDNYPGEIKVSLSGSASHAYFLMAGSTNHMQYDVINGVVTVRYTDGSEDELHLVNPDNWLPIEQDLFIDGYAFKTALPRPYRIAFKSGIVSRDLEKDLNIHPDEVYGRIIDGGAGVILDLPLDPTKELESFSIHTIANDVIIGLMSITLLR